MERFIRYQASTGQCFGRRACRLQFRARKRGRQDGPVFLLRFGLVIIESVSILIIESMALFGGDATDERIVNLIFGKINAERLEPPPIRK
jgi:hypothetical protein